MPLAQFPLDPAGKFNIFPKILKKKPSEIDPIPITPAQFYMVHLKITN